MMVILTFEFEFRKQITGVDIPRPISTLVWAFDDLLIALFLQRTVELIFEGMTIALINLT